MTKRKIEKNKILDAIKGSMGNVSLIARRLNINRHTAQRYIDTDPVIREDYLQEREGSIDFAENALFKQISKGDTRAIIFYLQTIGKDRGYRDVKDIQLAGQLDLTPIQPIINFVATNDKENEKAGD